MSQQDVADALGVSVRTMKRWEHDRDRREPPADAVKLLEQRLETQRRMVEYLVNVCERVAKEQGIPVAAMSVPITYYRDQAMYDRCGRDPGAFGIANANSRAAAQALEERGYSVEFRYPCDSDSSISAARSATESD